MLLKNLYQYDLLSKKLIPEDVRWLHTESLFYYSEYSRDLLIEIIQCSMDDVRIYVEHESDYADKIFDSIESALSELKKYNFEFKELDFKLVK